MGTAKKSPGASVGGGEWGGLRVNQEMTSLKREKEKRGKGNPKWPVGRGEGGQELETRRGRRTRSSGSHGRLSPAAPVQEVSIPRGSLWLSVGCAPILRCSLCLGTWHRTRVSMPLRLCVAMGLDLGNDT